ncbi:MAG: hypothetical protein SFV15_22930 [Polyangiaceae bacterium]|nr:hypothetical protein [Polyangiaceae bacterium]
MNTLKAKVVGGHFVIEERTDLPEGTELYLVPVNEEDEDRFDVEEANKALLESKATLEQPIPWGKVKAELGL